jgi:hypothetical protein
MHGPRSKSHPHVEKRDVRMGHPVSLEAQFEALYGMVIFSVSWW